MKKIMQIQALEMIDIAIKETINILSIDKDPLIYSFLQELNRYKSLATIHWPLNAEEKLTVDIGRAAVRELDNSYPQYATLLSQVGALLRNSL